jgi:TRAP-type C4-dicarboxylate transport system permease small subunit
MSHAPLSAPEPAGATPFSRAVGAVSLVCGAASATMILAAVIVTCQMIWMRFVLGQSTIWQTEAVTYLVIGATLVGLPYVQKMRGHVNVDLIPNMLPRPLRRLLAAFVLLVSMAVIGVMGWHGWELFHIAWVRGWTSESVWGAPLWVPFLAMPLGFGLFLLQLIADLFDALAGGEF